ncbi:hypothetical protein GL305_10545, partial [Nocardia seriolae]|nr:hypothetical protein [Nocardia seriolae]MTJ86433.1 hypothetical protein [Nocardia seriolae]MTK30427.1 hypothetical protein [Nocardia seriolae]MTK46997.1 hypothetical protein [Nocardia seriolae]
SSKPSPPTANESTTHDTRMVLVTSNFHILRTAILARHLDLDAEVTGARTAFYYLPSAILREYTAILFEYKWINAVACLAMAALPLLVTVAAISSHELPVGVHGPDR